MNMKEIWIWMEEDVVFKQLFKNFRFFVCNMFWSTLFELYDHNAPSWSRWKFTRETMERSDFAVYFQYKTLTANMMKYLVFGSLFFSRTDILAT